MAQTNINNFGAIDFRICWKSEHARHTDRYYAEKVNFWRDFFPEQISGNILKKGIGETVKANVGAGELVPAYDAQKFFAVKIRQIRKEFAETLQLPRKGRFYPKGMLSDIANIFAQNMEPFRCAGTEEDRIFVDLNHPLARKDIQLSATVADLWEKESDTGGSCHDWPIVITDGPGMQARYNGGLTDFFASDAFERGDNRSDRFFYESPRWVNHLDDTAIATIRDLYETVLPTDAAVLDLMSSWTSHLPEKRDYVKVTGLGMNAAELAENRRLTDAVVHDLNETPILPFADGAYDAIICTASVEYLIRPFEVFGELYRVLAPGGVLITTFSNRWFPPKAISIWTRIHEFERMGLVMEYFMDQGRFTDLETLSVRGLPRPEDDKYYGQFWLSDPVYAVWGRKAG